MRDASKDTSIPPRVHFAVRGCSLLGIATTSLSIYDTDFGEFQPTQYFAEFDQTFLAYCYRDVLQVCETLIAYARSSLKRFDTVEDTTGRVLAGGVANRWNTRLKVLYRTVLVQFPAVDLTHLAV